MSYHDTTRALYREAALEPQSSLCCAPGPAFRLPGLSIPSEMRAMNYGCGTTVHFQDLSPELDVLYLGVGGGLEALQFAYFTRRPRSVIALDPVAEMREKARSNLLLAERSNPWFRAEFVEILDGDALDIPLPVGRVDLVAQNCLFNIFTQGDLDRALREAARVLRPGGRLALSDPICEQEIPERLRSDERLRAACLSGALTLERYVQRIVAAGFGTVEIRARRPYRVLDRRRYGLEQDVLLESLEAVAVHTPVPEDGACVFAGETVIYVGEEDMLDDGRGHVILRDVPLSVCRKTASRLRSLGRGDLIVTPPTWHYAGGGCC
ncbi:MAG: arsenosugar biosynthesis arsenite methyltransferase ArsM [Candidatus Latescibacteria bacterium]|nr:arsenosugar biosynthesis arsenite methyltransferase ArsM [Candidatus Latescibacterota bacterium]